MDGGDSECADKETEPASKGGGWPTRMALSTRGPAGRARMSRDELVVNVRPGFEARIFCDLCMLVGTSTRQDSVSPFLKSAPLRLVLWI